MNSKETQNFSIGIEFERMSVEVTLVILINTKKKKKGKKNLSVLLRV